MLCTIINVFQHIVKLTNQQTISNYEYDFSLLPPHILAKIFSYVNINDLKNSAHVCKSWYYATCDEKIAKRLTVWIKADTAEMDFLCRPIMSIHFHELKFNKFCNRQVIQKFGNSITELYIYSDKITHTTIFEMILNLPNLAKFQIYDGGLHFMVENFHRHKKINHRKQTIIKHLAQIKNLQITTRLKNFEPYKLFWRHCVNLEILSWTRNDKYTEDEFKEFINQFLDPEENRTLKNLTDLSIHNIGKRWNSEFFEKMVHLNLRKIRKLSLWDVSSAYYDVMFKEFCRTYQQLVYLNMKGCNDRQLYDICNNMPNLKQIELKRCEANNFEELTNLQALEFVRLERIYYAIDDGLLTFFTSKPKYLTYLWFNIVSAPVFVAICENCPNLEVLILEEVETQDCEPIFRNLIKLKNFFILFSELAKCHSSQIISSDMWNILRLSRLEELQINCYVPGITPDLIKQHPILNQSCMIGVWDPTQDDLVQQELEDEEYFDLDEQYDHNEVGVSQPIDTFEISDFEWFASVV